MTPGRELFHHTVLPFFFSLVLIFLIFTFPSTASRNLFKLKRRLPLIVLATSSFHSLPSNSIANNSKRNNYRASTLMKQVNHHIRKSQDMEHIRLVRSAPEGCRAGQQCSTLALPTGFASASESSLTFPETIYCKINSVRLLVYN